MNSNKATCIKATYLSAVIATSLLGLAACNKSDSSSPGGTVKAAPQLPSNQTGPKRDLPSAGELSTVTKSYEGALIISSATNLDEKTNSKEKMAAEEEDKQKKIEEVRAQLKDSKCVNTIPEGINSDLYKAREKKIGKISGSNCPIEAEMSLNPNFTEAVIHTELKSLIKIKSRELREKYNLTAIAINAQMRSTTPSKDDDGLDMSLAATFEVTTLRDGTLRLQISMDAQFDQKPEQNSAIRGVMNTYIGIELGDIRIQAQTAFIYDQTSMTQKQVWWVNGQEVDQKTYEEITETFLNTKKSENSEKENKNSEFLF